MVDHIERLFALDGPVASERAVSAAMDRWKRWGRLVLQLDPVVRVGATVTMVLMAGAFMASLSSDAAYLDVLVVVLVTTALGLVAAAVAIKYTAGRALRNTELLDPIVAWHEKELIDLCDQEPRLATLRDRIAAVRPLRRGDFRALHKEFERLRITRLHLAAALMREHEKAVSAPAPAPDPNPANDPGWVAHAYPLQQILIRLQGTRHSDRAAIISQLEEVLGRLRAGHLSGAHHDDDFGYDFLVDPASIGPSYFDKAAESR